MVANHAKRQEAEEKKHRAALKEEINILDGMATVVVHNLSMLLPNKNKIQPISMQELFAELFADPSPVPQDKSRMSGEMQLYKAQRIEAAYRHNALRHRGKEE